MSVQDPFEETAAASRSLATQSGAARAPVTSAPTEPEAHGLYRVGLAYGRVVHRLRWLIIVLWIVGVAVSVPFAARVGSVLAGDGFSFSGSESTKVQNALVNTLHQPPAQLLVVFQSRDVTTSDYEYQNEVSGFVARARTFAHVTDVTTGGTGQDQRTTFVSVSFNQNESWVEDHLPAFRALLPQPGPDAPATVYLTGGPVVSHEFSTTTESDTEHAELYALPIALLVLLVVFGTLVAASMPLLLALVAVPVALAGVYGIALHDTLSVFVLNVASIVGLGISIDYSLFMTRRFRGELALGRSVREAVAWTVATAGEAILFSGMTVMIGFVGLLLIGIQFMTSLAIGGALVVGAAALASLTLLPALLGVLGPRVNALRLPLLGQLVWRPDRDAGEIPLAERRGFWQTWARAVMRWPLLTIVLVGGLLLVIGWPVLSINLGSPSTSSLPASSEARQGLDILNAQFPATGGNIIQIIARTPDGSSILNAGNLTRVDDLTRWLGAQRDVSSVTSITRLPAGPDGRDLSVPQLAALYGSGAYQQMPGLARLVASTTNGDTTLITLQSSAKVDSPAGNALIDRLRAGDRAAGAGLSVLVGGEQATSLDFTRYLFGNFPRAIVFILLATYILLLLMFRSVLLPLKAILMNVLSVSAAYGVLVAVFQWGYGSSLLGFQSSGVIDSFIPILMFCILFGLSMDYEVFLLSRIREEWLRTHNNRWAVARGLEQTGGVITNAALLFVIVTGAFTFTRLVITKEIGLGMTTAVLVDAAIIRMLLVPATMRLLGRWNWWLPGRPLPPKQIG